MSADQILRRAGTLKADRATTDAHWQDVANFLLPSREFTTRSTPGSQSRQRWIYNTTPVSACEQLAGGLHGMLTSPALRWFKMIPSGVRADQMGDTNSEVQEWFEDSTERMYARFNSPKAGFNTSAHESYLDISAFGCGPMFVGDGGKAGPMFRSVPLAECYISLDAWGSVDTLFRCFQWSARNIKATWPKCRSEPLLKACETNPDQRFEIVHAVYPRPDGMNIEGEFASCYVLKDGAEVLEDGGYLEFPYAFARWSRRSGEDYGFGPGMMALPDVRMLNKITEVSLRALAKAADPPMGLPSDGFLSPLNLNPGAINYYDADAAMKDRVLTFGTQGRPDLAMDFMESVSQRIRELFYVTWMNLPSRPNMTATEVLQRRDEQLRLLGPMVARLQQEFLGPIIERTFAIMWRNGLFAPAPDALSGIKWEVEYQSPLALAQKASDADSVLKWLGFIAEAAKADPAVLDVADLPKTARFMADRYGTPASAVRTTAEVEELAAGRQQQQAGMAQIGAAQGIAKAAKDGAGALNEVMAMGGAA
jgi:hypothetical protein